MTYCLNMKQIATTFCIAFLIFSVSSGIIVSPAPVSSPGTYDFRDTTNNTAYWGNNNTRPPPALVGTDEIIFSAYQYGQIAYLDNSDCETSDGLIDYSDYHRFAFRIFEPVSNILSIYVKHVGYGNYIWDVTQNPGLTLYIWNNSISQWSFLDDHNSGTSNAVADYTITSNIGWYINGSGYVNLLAQAKENTGSCPFLYTFNGEKYVFVTDMFNRGMLSLSVRSMQPQDYAKIEEDQLLQTDGLYKLQITQEYDEIAFLDKVTLITVDHPSNVDIFPSIMKTVGEIYTVSKDLATPVSASDANGYDVLKLISSRDGQFTIAEQYELNYVDLNLGDLSGANDIKLVLTAYTNWDNSEVLTSNATNRHGGFVQVKDSGGNWVTVYSKELTTPSALPRTYVLNMTGKFLTNDHSVRIAYYPDVRFDYIGIDTSPEVAVTVNILAPNYADLHFRGYSVMSGSPSTPDYYDFGPSPIEGYSDPSGNFTRYGDVLPLIMNRDDEFVIMHHGDEISTSFAYIPPEEGLERDFLLYSYGYYKGSPYPTGDSVDPLPFYGMTRYPYNSTESYPTDAEHLAYLQEYNTRTYSGSSPELPPHGTIYTDYVMLQVTELGNVSGYKLNANDSSGLSGWSIYLWNSTDNSLLDTTTTDGSGFWNFTNIITGAYSVMEVLQPGWFNVTPRSFDFIIGGTSVDVTHNFTNYQLGNLSGYKLNANDFSGLSGWTIYLFDSSDGSLLDTMTTDGNGFYKIINIPSGNYSVVEEVKAGWTNSTPTYYNFTVFNNGTVLTYNFTNYPRLAVGGFAIPVDYLQILALSALATLIAIAVSLVMIRRFRTFFRH